MKWELGVGLVLRTNWIGPKVVRGYNFGIPGIQTIYFELGYVRLKFSWLNFEHVSRGGF
jgi:hypothetical protein